MEYPKVNLQSCAGCAICAEVCPLEAIQIENEKAHINEKNCGNCRACVSMCPMSAIG
ncbi:MAG: 4Fe-4S binding protein [Bacteroidota bacterium]